MITLLYLWSSQTDLAKLLISDNLDAVVTWRISKLVNILRDLERSRVDLIKRFGELDENNNFRVTGEENIKKFTIQFQELLNEPLPASSFQPIELEKLERAKLNAVEMARLGWLIIGPEE